ncbi:MAG: hypothetical protein ACTHLN_14780 [Tepidisphaeraceae bacterium]
MSLGISTGCPQTTGGLQRGRPFHPTYLCETRRADEFRPATSNAPAARRAVVPFMPALPTMPMNFR